MKFFGPPFYFKFFFQINRFKKFRVEIVLKGQEFCPRCGKTGEKLFSGLCRSCFIEDIKLISLPDELELTICTQCGSIQKKGRWHDSNLTVEDMAAETILEHVEVTESVLDVEIFPEIQNVRGSNLEYLVKVIGKVLDHEVCQEYLVKVKVVKNVCNECSKYASGYYEAVIQLRADDRTPSPDEIKTADDILKNQLERLSENNRMAYITQRAEIKEGVDYYIGSYKVARKLTESFKNELGGVMGESPRLMGHDKHTGKDLFRIWILLRLSKFFKGDFVKYNQAIAEIVNFDGSKIYLEVLKTDQRLSVPWKAAGKMELAARKGDIKKALVSAITPDHIQILHPETYQPLEIPINQQKPNIKIGKEIPVVEIEGNFYLLNNRVTD